jgi:hypothetical protein
LIKSVVKKTIGQGKIPILMTNGPIWISFPPINSATTALVIKIPARIINTMSFLDLNISDEFSDSNLLFLFLIFEIKKSHSVRNGILYWRLKIYFRLS